MCTAIVSFDPSADLPVLLVGVRDELLGRPWIAPGRHWPDRPDLVGGQDLRAGGTWLAVAPDAPRVACVVNGFGPPAPESGRQSRGLLPLLLAGGGSLPDPDLSRFDPFHLVAAEPRSVRLFSWDGAQPRERILAPGLHILVNTGLNGGDGNGFAPPRAAHDMAARLAYFRPRLLAAQRPQPTRGDTGQAWSSWLGLVEGDGLDLDDPRAMILRRDIGEGQLWGSSSVSLVALRADGGCRYDFKDVNGTGQWHTILD